MVLAIVIAAVGLGIVAFGAKGFSEEGIPLTYDRSLCGPTGRCIGIVCLLVGSPLILVGLLMMLVGGV